MSDKIHLDFGMGRRFLEARDLIRSAQLYAEKNNQPEWLTDRLGEIITELEKYARTAYRVPKKGDLKSDD